MPKGVIFTDGDQVGRDWHVVYAGYGAVQRVGTGTLQLQPATATSPDVTHGAAVVTNRSFGDIDLTASLRTVQQLRRGSQPHPWEVAWLLWHYTDDTHFYSLVLKPNGWELGKEDPAYPGAQRYLATGSTPTFPIGPWYHVRVRQVGASITVWVNGTKLVSTTDRERPYLTGGVGLYDEDAQVQFRDVTITSP